MPRAPAASAQMNWEDCNNYVAKRYMASDATDAVYFSDCKMQMVAKRYARLYNALGPPKGVDVELKAPLRVVVGLEQAEDESKEGATKEFFDNPTAETLPEGFKYVQSGQLPPGQLGLPTTQLHGYVVHMP